MDSLWDILSGRQKNTMKNKNKEVSYKPLSKRIKNKYPIGTRIRYLGRKKYKIDIGEIKGTVKGYGEYVPLIYVDWDNSAYNLPIWLDIDNIEIIKDEENKKEGE